MARDQVTGMVLSDDAFEWTTLQRARDGFSVAGRGRIELGTERADESEDQPGVAVETETISRIKAECGAIKGHVSAGIPSDQLLLRVVSLPLVDDAELGSMVQLQADKFSPFPVENMVISHEILARRDDSCLVLVGVVRKDVVESVGLTYEKSGISLTRVDARVLGRWRLLCDVADAGEGGHVSVLLDGTVPEIIVVQDGVPVVFRSLGDSVGLTDEELSDEIAREVGYTLMSLGLELGVGDISSACVWHDGALPALIVEKLKDECGCEVVARPLDSSLPSISEGLARRLAEQGAGLDMSPDDWRTKAKSVAFKKRMLIVIAVLVGAWLSAAGVLLGGLYHEERKLSAMREEATRWLEPAMSVRALRRRVRMIQRYTTRTHSAIECLREVSAVQPKGIDLTSFRYNKDEWVRISGEAARADLVYTFKDKLHASKLFEDTTLRGPFFNRKKKKETFDIEMVLPGGEQ